MRLSVLMTILMSVTFLSSGCKNGSDWPDAPLFPPPLENPDWVPPVDKDEAIAEIAKHYAYYDNVAYEGETKFSTFRAFFVTYGIADFKVENGELVQHLKFCKAEYIANQDVKSTFSDRWIRAIKPTKTVVSVSKENGQWKIWRPATPTLIGFEGDPNMPLPSDRKDPGFIDADEDGNPGVTINIRAYNMVNMEVYVARREIFEHDLTLYPDGSLYGQVLDDGSEQFVIGSNPGLLTKFDTSMFNPPQYPDLELSPIKFIPIDKNLTECDQLMNRRDEIFPKTPKF